MATIETASVNIDTSLADIDTTVRAAAKAAPDWAASEASVRAGLLRGLADALDGDATSLVELADTETSLGPARLAGEVARTSFQLRGFASQVEAGSAFKVEHDPAVAGPPPAGHAGLLKQRVPLGPVAMFAASNFPFAFSVLGGDTASALAAGCPVVVKAHPGHANLSRRVHAVAQNVLRAQALPAGLIGFVEGAGHGVGVALIRHPQIEAAAFTGSVRGGQALLAEANARPRPIPFFGELGSINPVVALPTALAAQGDALALALAQSIANGTGQFCTSPGVIIVFPDVHTERFLQTLASALAQQATHPMLTPAIRNGFDAGLLRLRARPTTRVLLAPPADVGSAPRPALVRVPAGEFIADAALHDEVFGPAALVVDASSLDEAIAVLNAIGGSLTATLWGANEATPDNLRLVRAATRLAGRVLFAGVPTGVAVAAGQQHGGPWPSSTLPATTSVGWAALDRFLRPVAYQDAPAWLAERGGRPV